jgi:hypothetical protein
MYSLGMCATSEARYGRVLGKGRYILDSALLRRLAQQISMFTILIDSLSLSARVMRWVWIAGPIVVIVIGAVQSI